jgi:hypothetical protein
MKEAYQKILLVFGLIGLVAVLRYKEVNQKMAISFIAMVVVIFGFFSIIVKTKMPAFVFPVSALIFAFMALGAFAVIDLISERWKIPVRDKQIAFTVLTIGLGIACFKPWDIAVYRSASNDFRNAKINNTLIYENLPEEITKNYVIINCKSFENVELMFHQDARAYHWYPAENVIDSLQNLGYKFAAFRNTPNQGLPEYILGDPEIVLLEDAIQ